jgi:cytosine/adenosine deaminase-related metal-dependent hydrolase
MSNVEFFDSIGILRSNTCLAHCIWLNEKEIALVKEHGAKVLHCPSSNLKLGSGIANIPEYLRRGISVSLGADGAPCNNRLDMFEEMRLAALIQKPDHGPEAMDAQTVFELATLGGARVLGLQRSCGSLEPGKKADLVVLDCSRVWNPATEEDVYSTIVYSGSPENVRSVMIDGRWVRRDGTTVTLDEPGVAETARRELRLLRARVH